jgi:cold shock CspA family protein
MIGFVKWFNSTRFGFIRGDDDQEIFVHISNVDDDCDTLRKARVFRSI